MRILIVGVVFLAAVGLSQACTVTTASGARAPSTFCSGDLIFEDNFNTPLDKTKWRHDVTLGGGGNWEVSLSSKILSQL